MDCASTKRLAPITETAMLGVQHIMALPAPELATTVKQSADDDSEDELPHLTVPALPQLQHLQPAKLAVWRLFMEQVHAAC